MTVPSIDRDRWQLLMKVDFGPSIIIVPPYEFISTKILHPAVGDDFVAFLLRDDVWIHDVAEASNIQITTDAIEKLVLKAGTDVIAWSDDRNGNTDIFRHYIPSG